MSAVFVAVQVLVVLSVAVFCLVGFAMTMVRRRRDQLRAAAFDLAATVVLDDGVDAEKASVALAGMPRRVAAEVLLELAADVNGEARRRIRLVAAQAGLSRRIERWTRLRRWHRRAQAAHLLSLLEPTSSAWDQLLSDRHPLVRARAIDSLTSDEIGGFADRILEAFDHDSPAVRSAAQHALVRGGVSCAEPIAELLTRLDEGDCDPDALVLVAEVAAHLPDARVVEALTSFVSHPDPRLRLLVATCLGNGTFAGATDLLAPLLVDGDDAVRAEAARSVGRIGGSALAADVGLLLGDRSWQVRRNAGAALVALGPIGRVVLRCHLEDPDRFARDMALHVLGRQSRLGDVLGDGDRWLAA